MLLLVTGLGLLAWLIDKALIHPWDRISGALPFWIPFVVTVLVGIAGLTYLFLRAARRVQAGEDLFAQRHRRRPDDPRPS